MAALAMNRINRSLTDRLPRSQTIARPPRHEILDPVEEVRAAHCLYTRLRAEQVRILTVHAAVSDNEQIKCSLNVESRTSVEKKYLAISYTWGSDQLNSKILCNGIKLPVTQNCEAALRALRRVAPNASGLDRRVWIDGVCIAQHDTDERTQQVARMGETFAQAEGCVIYLGRSDEQAKILEDMLDRYDQYGDLDPWLAPRGATKLFSREKVVRRALEAVKSVVERPWFDRAWVVQEVLLAADLTIQLGGRNFQWRTFASVLAMCVEAAPPARSLSWPITAAAGSIQLEPAVVQLHKLYRPAVPLNAQEARSAPFIALDHSKILGILQNTSQLKCRDPQDKLYSLLPLFEQPLPEKIVPNYRKKVADVFIDLTETLLTHDLEEVLALAQYTHLNGELPSWVVWWALLPAQSTLTRRRRLGVGAPGRLDAREVRLSRRTHFQIVEKRLQVRGLLVDQIQGLEAVTSGPAVRRFSRPARTASSQTQQEWERATMSTITSTSSGIELDAALNVCPLGQWQAFTTLDGFRAVAAKKVADEVYGPRAGDWIGRFLGCYGYFVLRKHELTGEFKLVGECMFINGDRCPRPMTPAFAKCAEVKEIDQTTPDALYTQQPVAQLKDLIIT